MDTLNAEAKRLLGVMHECDATLAHQRVKRQEADEVQRQLTQKLEKHVRAHCASAWCGGGCRAPHAATVRSNRLAHPDTHTHLLASDSVMILSNASGMWRR